MSFVKYDKKELVLPKMGHIKGKSCNSNDSSRFLTLPVKQAQTLKLKSAHIETADHSCSALKRDTSTIVLTENLKLKHKFIPSEKLKHLKEIISVNMKESLLRKFEMIKLRSKLYSIIRQHNIVSKEEMDSILNQASLYSQFIESELSKQAYLYSKYVKKLNKFTFNQSSLDYLNPQPFYHVHQDNIILEEEILTELTPKELELIKDNPSFFKFSSLNSENFKNKSLFEIIKEEELKVKLKKKRKSIRVNASKRESYFNCQSYRPSGDYSNSPSESKMSLQTIESHHKFIKSSDFSRVDLGLSKNSEGNVNDAKIETNNIKRSVRLSFANVHESSTIIDLKTEKNDKFSFIQKRKGVGLETRDILIKRNNYKQLGFNLQPATTINEKRKVSVNPDNHRDLLALIRNNYRKTNHVNLS